MDITPLDIKKILDEHNAIDDLSLSELNLLLELLTDEMIRLIDDGKDHRLIKNRIHQIDKKINFWKYKDADK